MLKKWFSAALGGTSGGNTETSNPPIQEAMRLEALRASNEAIGIGDLDLARAKLAPLLGAESEDAEALATAGLIAFLSGALEDAQTILQKSLNLDPANANATKLLAGTFFRLGQDQSALPYAERAASMLPQDDQILNLLGVLYTNAERYGDAADQFHKALEIAPERLLPLVNLAGLETQGRMTRRANDVRPRTEHIKEQALNRLLDAHRQSTLTLEDAKYLLALTSTSFPHFDVARLLADQLYDMNAGQQNAELANLMTKTFMSTGEVRKAMEMMSLVVQAKPLETGPKSVFGHLLIAEGGPRWREGWRLTNEEFPKLHQSAFAGEVPTWTGETPLAGLLFVYQDQGSGDVLLALRFLTMLAARNIRFVLWVTPGIADLVRTVPGLEKTVTSSKRPDPRSLNCTSAVPLFGLPAALGLQPQDLNSPPIAVPDGTHCESWKSRLGLRRKINIGLVAMGNPWRNDDWMRSIPSADLAPLQKYCSGRPDDEGVEWVNLSVDSRSDLTESIAMLGMRNPAPEFRSFADTAAAISALDAVIAIDCSVAHLAATMGKRLWVLIPPCVEWRWRIGDKINPWWPAAIVFQCERPGEWKDTIAQLIQSLDQAIARGELGK